MTESTDTGHAFGLDRVLAVANGKGGTFKTSICSAVGGLVAAAGWRVLVIDFDPQANLTEDLGLAEDTDEGQHQLEAIPVRAALRPHQTGRDNLWIVYGGHYLHDLQSIAVARQGRDPQGWMHYLADSLAPIAGDFDVVLIDCPPGSEALQTLALTAASSVLIPTKSDAGSRKGLREIARRFQSVRPNNPALELLGVVLTGVGASASVIRAEARADIENDLGGAAPVLATTIRHAERPAREARNQGKLPHELETELAGQKPWHVQLREGTVERGLPPSTTGLAQDYAELTQEILNRLSTTSQEATA